MNGQLIGLKEQFQSPPASHRPAPLWVWNDEMDAGRIREHLQLMAKGGFGGAFVHPRPGLVTPYLSEEWFSLWEVALEEAERLGIKLYIYDENSYPSGFAGGNVPAELPDCLANCAILKVYGLTDLPALATQAPPMLRRPGKPIRAYAMKEIGDGRYELLHDITTVPAAQWGEYGEQFWCIELGVPETSTWLGGFAYADLLRPEVTEAFLRSTHEQYAARFGERFGSSIPALFTDEPEISPGNLFEHGHDFVPFTYWFASQFEQRNGYSLLDYLPFLFREAASSGLPHDAMKVRYDYYTTIHDLWTDNSVRPISQWCEAHGIAYTGHYMEHNWPQPFNRSSPSVMSMYEYMHWPAIDMLMAFLLDDRTARNFPAFLDDHRHLMITIREAHSAANQFDRPRVLCEAYGAGGWDSTFEDYKRIGDWLYVHGINFLNPHLTYSTIVGARKRDHPQSFDWRQPWWEEFGTLNDYFARLSVALSSGKTYNRILVLNPTTSSYLYTPESYTQGDSAALADDTRELAQRLADSGWDYDWGDEYILARHGKADGSSLQVAARRYDLVIIPPAMVNMKRETTVLLQQLLQNGGTAIVCGDIAQRVDGAAWPEQERAALLQQCRHAADFPSLATLLAELLPLRTRWKSGVQERNRIGQLIRDHEDGSMTIFLANSTGEPLEDYLAVTGAYAEYWDPFSGGNAAADTASANAGQLEIPVSLPGSGSLLLRIYPLAPETETTVAAAAHVAHVAQVARIVQPAETKAYFEQENSLPLFYCDLYLGQTKHTQIYSAHACQIVYEYYGFAGNPWDNAVQFRSRLLDQEAALNQQQGPIIEYCFTVLEDEVPNTISLAIERPELYDVTVNGVPVAMAAGSSKLDHHIGTASISHAVQAGNNRVRLASKGFSIFMEIEAIYIQGDFRVVEHQGQWAIARPAPLQEGSWRTQGYPFYSGSARYSQEADIPSAATNVNIQLPSWAGVVARVEVNGEWAGIIGADHRHELDITNLVRRGSSNRIEVRVSGSLRNLFGPHFDPSTPRKVAWPAAWKASPLTGPPAASSFDLLDYGLFEPFQVRIT